MPCVSWRELLWYPCSTYFGTCGYGVQQRKFSCISSRNESTQRSLCQDTTGKIENLFTLKERERRCKVPCDTETQYTNWSQWGLCRKDCASDSTSKYGLQIRSRTSFVYNNNFTQTIWENQTCSPPYCYTYKVTNGGCSRVEDDQDIDSKFCNIVIQKKSIPTEEQLATKNQQSETINTNVSENCSIRKICIELTLFSYRSKFNLSPGIND